MRRFIYFFPGLSNASLVDDELKEKCGLSRVLDHPFLQHNPLQGAGPNGSAGLLVTRELGDGPAVSYQKDSQTWIECADGAFWLGWNELPGPNDLRRDDAPECLWGTRLADGNQWAVPTARLHASKGRSMIPQRISLDPKGNQVLVPVARFKTLTDYAAQAMTEFDRATAEESTRVSFDPAWLFDACVECLATIYRVSKWEVGALGILATDNMVSIVSALVDEPTRMMMQAAAVEAAKKNSPASTGVT